MDCLDVTKLKNLFSNQWHEVTQSVRQWSWRSSTREHGASRDPGKHSAARLE
jgi:hypothetical protein